MVVTHGTCCQALEITVTWELGFGNFEEQRGGGGGGDRERETQVFTGPDVNSLGKTHIGSWFQERFDY